MAASSGVCLVGGVASIVKRVKSIWRGTIRIMGGEWRKWLVSDGAETGDILGILVVLTVSMCVCFMCAASEAGPGML